MGLWLASTTRTPITHFPMEPPVRPMTNAPPNMA